MSSPGELTILPDSFKSLSKVADALLVAIDFGRVPLMLQKVGDMVKHAHGRYSPSFGQINGLEAWGALEELARQRSRHMRRCLPRH